MPDNKPYKTYLTRPYLTPELSPEKFGENLIIQLYNVNKTQADLARELGVCRSAVSAWCHGVNFPSHKYLPKLLEILQCKIEDLFN